MKTDSLKKALSNLLDSDQAFYICSSNPDGSHRLCKKDVCELAEEIGEQLGEQKPDPFKNPFEGSKPVPDDIQAVLNKTAERLRSSEPTTLNEKREQKPDEVESAEFWKQKYLSKLIETWDMEREEQPEAAEAILKELVILKRLYDKPNASITECGYYNKNSPLAWGKAFKYFESEESKPEEL